MSKHYTPSVLKRTSTDQLIDHFNKIKESVEYHQQRMNAVRDVICERMIKEDNIRAKVIYVKDTTVRRHTRRAYQFLRVY